VRAAAAAALAAGAAAERVHVLLAAAAARDLDSLPLHLLALCVQAGLSPDTGVGGGESLLHLLLNAPHPVPLGNLDDAWQSRSSGAEQQQQPGGVSQQVEQLQEQLQQLQGSIPLQEEQQHPACGGVTLAELLRRGRPSPNLPDAHGNTALHILVACMITKRHFPDPKAGEGQQQQQEAEQPGAPSPPAAAATLQDHDAARAAYAAAAFAALLRAGWHPGVRNANGYTVTDLLEEGMARYRAGEDEEAGVATACHASLTGLFPRKLACWPHEFCHSPAATIPPWLLPQYRAAGAAGP
jgi:hypothetical protein